MTLLSKQPPPLNMNPVDGWRLENNEYRYKAFNEDKGYWEVAIWVRYVHEPGGIFRYTGWYYFIRGDTNDSSSWVYMQHARSADEAKATAYAIWRML